MRRIDELKTQAEQLGVAPYAKLYGDKRCTATWQRLLESKSELEPLHPRQPEKSPQTNWKLAIALFVGAIALVMLLQPWYSRLLKLSPVKINIQFSVGTKL